MRKVLLVEANADWSRIFREKVGSAVEIVHAVSSAHAEELARNHQRFDAIVLGDVDALSELPDRLRSFGRVLVAAAFEPHHNDQLMEAGCMYRAPRKELAAGLLLQVLG